MTRREEISYLCGYYLSFLGIRELLSVLQASSGCSGRGGISPKATAQEKYKANTAHDVLHGSREKQFCTTCNIDVKHKSVSSIVTNSSKTHTQTI